MTRIVRIGKPVMGVLLLAVGAMTVSGVDKRIEAWMVDRMPGWLVELTTRL
jgi:cytochrome c-type biogenesis protein